MKKTCLLGAGLLFFVFGCGDGLKKDLQQSLQQISSEQKNFPQPKFDAELEILLGEYKEKYQAEGVRIGRPYMYSSEGDSSYWLKVEFLNAELGDKTFGQFGKEVAQNTYGHLTNNQDFEKVEVSLVQKKGFILTFTSSQNGYYYRDSLGVRN
jgi:hypothetical protein